ncbi:MAG TPA: PspC domain-containing protein [Solirubrobacterales bacterium]|nr:PspC domain-containing protein [Solirubrobacterales bacterium]
MSLDRRRLRRAGDGALLGGVCAGIAHRLDIDPILVRIATVILTVATGGMGAVAYGLLWLIVPGTPKTRRAGEEAKPTSRHTWLIGAGFGMVTLGLLFIFRELGIWWSDSLVWPTVLAGAGAGLLWRQFSGSGESEDAAEPETPAWAASGERRPAVRSRPRSRLGPYRGAFGFALVIGAAMLFLYVQGAFSAASEAALAGVTLIVVLGLILAPLWVRLARNLGRERAERIRSQERAEVAAHLHDSVLQTLALMQKKSDDPRQVSTLARRQERELREWLSGKSERERETSLASALEAAAAEVEERHGVPIDAVTVGDRPLDERTVALVAASREAMTNAVRYAGDAGTIRLYAEITPEETQVFVRDRGRGFDLDAVPEDRRGVRDSILGRMERNGGAAEVRSGIGEGTEIELTMETK